MPNAVKLFAAVVLASSFEAGPRSRSRKRA